MIELKNVTKTYGKNKSAFMALDDVSLNLEKGESVAIVGKSGSGKSTLMHVMSGLDSASDGEVIIAGESLHNMKPKAIDDFRATKMGFIFQSFFIQANETCYDNVALPLEIAHVAKTKRKKLVENALKQVELSDKLHQKAKNLSGGQKQRLAIARAIVNKPKLLFADEPTGNLDSKTGDVIENLLFGLNKKLGCTLVIVTHDEDLAAKCDRRTYIKDGKVTKVTKGKK